MFLESGWRPPQEPAPRRPRMSDREERTLMWFIVIVAILLVVAPIGGGTIIQVLYSLR